jgi:integrase
MRFRRPSGLHGKLTLGPFDPSGKEAADEPRIGYPLTLAAARALATNIKRQRERDIDIIAQYRTDKERSHTEVKEAADKTFILAARDFIEGHTVRDSDRKPRRWRETARLLGLDYTPTEDEPIVIKGSLCERWSERPVSEITEDNIYRVVKEARDEGTPGIKRRNKGKSNPRGRRMADALGTMFKWLKSERRITVNPCIGLDRPHPPKARDRVLNVKTDVRNADELRWFWAAASSEKISQPFGAVAKLLALTGCRLKEISRMTRDELSDDYAMLRLSGLRTKNGLPHDVPLPPLAREILKGVVALPGSNIIIFSTNGRTPVSGFSKIKKRLDAAMLEEARKERGEGATILPWKLHDLRRTCSTGMAGIGVLPHVIEAALNHVSGVKSGVAGVYNQEMYEPEKRVALDRWANHISGIVSGRKGAKVVPWKAGRR